MRGLKQLGIVVFRGYLEGTPNLVPLYDPYIFRYT